MARNDRFRCALFLVLPVLACGGSRSPGAVDLAPFLGQWNGTLLTTANSQTRQLQASFILVQVEPGTLEMVGFCSDDSGPRGTATSATVLSFSSVTCAPVAVSGCGAVTLSASGGSGTLSGGSLQITLDVREAGCEQSIPVTFAFTGSKRSAQAPVASISTVPGSPVSIGRTVALDGSGSHDPQGGTLSYAWSLQDPPGSVARLSAAGGVNVSFTPDVAGTYLASLIVSAGGRSSTAATAAIVAQAAGSGGTAPTASLAAPSAAAPGQTLAFDASGSRAGSTGGTLSYAWALSEKPSGAAAQLTDAASSIAHLVPDAVGRYTVQLTLSDGAASASASATVLVQAGVTATLPYRPVAARYSRALDRLVFITSSPAALHLYDPVAQADTSVPLPLTPTCLSVSADGLFAAVGHDAWLTWLDLSAAAVVKTWPIAASAGDVVLGDSVTASGTPTRFAYVFPSRDQWVAVHNLDLGSGVEKTTATIYAGMRAALQPGTGRVFGVTGGLSPAQIYRFDADATGALASSGGSPYWGDYPMGYPIWISGDGAQLLTAAGTRFRTQDLTYAGTVSLPGASNSTSASLLWADFAPDGAHWLVAPAGASASAGDTALVTIDAQYLATPSQTVYPPFVHGNGSYALHGRWVFYDKSGAKKIAVTQVDPSAGALLDSVVLVF